MNFLKTHKTAISGISACLLIGGIALSFQDTPFNYLQHYTPETVQTDTVPEKKGNNEEKGMNLKEFENLTANLDKQIAEATNEIKKIDWSAIDKQVKDAMKEVDINKIQTEVSNALKEVDMAKISKEVSDALKEVNMEDLKMEINNAMNQAKKEMSKVNTAEIKKEIEKAREEVEKARLDMKKIDINKIMQNAKEGIDQAKAELKNISALFDELEKDHLINKKSGFKIEYKDKSLYINDKKQSDEVTDKYRHYFKDEHFEITIEKETVSL